MSAGPPRPRPWPGAAPAPSEVDDARRLTATEAYALYCGVVGYHLPRHLNRAIRLSNALTWLR